MKTISTEEFKQMRDKNPSTPLINVLNEEKFREHNIPGSANIPLDRPDFTRRVEQLVGSVKTKPVIVYCANTACDASTKAAQKLEQAGFTNVFDYKAGVKGWEEAGYELVHA